MKHEQQAKQAELEVGSFPWLPVASSGFQWLPDCWKSMACSMQAWQKKDAATSAEAIAVPSPELPMQSIAAHRVTDVTVDRLEYWSCSLCHRCQVQQLKAQAAEAQAKLEARDEQMNSMKFDRQSLCESRSCRALSQMCSCTGIAGNARGAATRGAKCRGSSGGGRKGGQRSLNVASTGPFRALGRSSY